MQKEIVTGVDIEGLDVTLDDAAEKSPIALQGRRLSTK
jgi:hypothetical protein